eukprot:CAMPEP_0117582676 /NCGR_PEP_ID=MMETSP0784-20121206/66570_1 /TAXON_ID=39447 /ORGANISM="" /LENGTH=124 /DNA_ID=CAMNT_0005383235 /DNA_START=166 /DNA_END=540 /DNA_ORIENTATION=+
MLKVPFQEIGLAKAAKKQSTVGRPQSPRRNTDPLRLGVVIQCANQISSILLNQSDTHQSQCPIRGVQRVRGLTDTYCFAVAAQCGIQIPVLVQHVSCVAQEQSSVWSFHCLGSTANALRILVMI